MSIPTILSGAAGRAINTLKPLTTNNTKTLDALVIVNRATPDIKAALGTEAGQRIGKQLVDASRRGGTQARAANREQVTLAINELQEAASATARTRVMIGALAVGGGIAGWAALRNADSSDGQIIAPGPAGHFNDGVESGDYA